MNSVFTIEHFEEHPCNKVWLDFTVDFVGKFPVVAAYLQFVSAVTTLRQQMMQCMALV